MVAVDQVHALCRQRTRRRLALVHVHFALGAGKTCKAEKFCLDFRHFFFPCFDLKLAFFTFNLY